MKAVVHFVSFAEDGVIESAATGMPGATDFVDKDGERKPIVHGATGRQRFACGPEASKWWALKDDKGVLHVATGEHAFVSCAACKKSKDYLDATGQSDKQGALSVQGEAEPGEVARKNDDLAAE